MKKIILFIVFISLLFVTGCDCRKSEISCYDEKTEWLTYLNMFYDDINTEGKKYVAVDLRSKTLYETEHLRQFQNYDLSVGNIDELYNWLTSNYSNKYSIYIYLESSEELNSFDVLLERYKNIYLYIGDYETLRILGDELFTFDSGPYDCNC